MGSEISTYETERGKPMPSKNHAIVQTRLIVALAKFENYSTLSEISLELPEGEKVPDIGIFTPVELTPGEDEIRMSEIPLGVVEILSPTQSLADLIAKSHAYFEQGVKSYWLALPDLKSIYVFSAPNEYEVFSKKEKLVDAQLGIELDLGEIFR